MPSMPRLRRFGCLLRQLQPQGVLVLVHLLLVVVRLKGVNLATRDPPRWLRKPTSSPTAAASAAPPPAF